jgi:orotate phosphoribosyltransferase
MEMRPGPSPAVDFLAARERARLRELIRTLSLKRGRFVLASGAISDYYLDLRLTTTHPEGARLAASFLLREAHRLGAGRVGGPTLGADPLVGAAVCLSAGTGDEVCGFLVRSQAKDHGTGKQIEGHLGRGDRVLILDDVVTAGGSILRACEAVRAAGAEIMGSWCLVDRGQGGREKLADAGAPLQALFEVREILSEDAAADSGPAAAGRWPPETPKLTVDAVLEPVPGQVLLIERTNPPYGWALPGGFVEPGESAEDAVRREIAEETGLILSELAQMHTYSRPDRDARMYTASVVFTARASGEAKAGDDAGRVRLFPLDHLPEAICFDHREILEDYRTRRYPR